MLKSALLIISMLMTLGIYVPLFKRIFERKHTRDFSKMSAWFVMLCQVNGFLLATAEHAHFLMILVRDTDGTDVATTLGYLSLLQHASATCEGEQ